MLTNKINENEYSVTIYDWINKHDDYICGTVKREPEADEGSDLRYWMFYPVGENTPINAGDLNRLRMFIANLNK